jgi:hypothetical protein
MQSFKIGALWNSERRWITREMKVNLQRLVVGNVNGTVSAAELIQKAVDHYMAYTLENIEPYIFFHILGIWE